MMGQYIINAYLLLVKDLPVPLLDVNMARLLERYFGPRKLADIRFDQYLQQLSKRIVDHSESKLLNWAILDYSAMICKSRKPACSTCIIKEECKYIN
jgi:A/G-specific adenine glycosylase